MEEKGEHYRGRLKSAENLKMTANFTRLLFHRLGAQLFEESRCIDN